MWRTLLLLGAGALVTSVPVVEDQITPRDGEKCGYDSCTDASPDVLNVHIVAHTHDDVGWLKTVDQYYYGSRNNIQKAGVKYILDSVVKELWEDPKRRFIYVETAFFWKWWIAQPDSVKSRVHTLVRQGRLQFVGGAWSMNDEAASHYHSTIDQFTWGLRKLNDTFGSCGRPTVGWQIDPFGHSREFASDLAMMGYDGLFLGRIDYQDKRQRLKDKTMEMIWRGSDDLGESTDIFTSVLYNTYSPPPGFCFDVLCDDEPIIDDIDSPMYNVEKRVTDFLEYVLEEAKHYRSNNVIVTMGGDFTYQDAFMWFDNLDKLIKYTNLKAGKEGLNVKAFYSTPACYLKAVKDANPTLPIKQDDFFPYASDPYSYWTGYFSSRPTTKFMEREAHLFLQSFQRMQVLLDLPKTNSFVLNELKSAVGVMQHHDAITGTEKQHVAHDYERIVSQAVDDAWIVANQGLNKLLKPPEELVFQRCMFNQSQCAVTEDSDSFIVTLFNNLATPKQVLSDTFAFPVVKANYSVYDENGNPVPSQLNDIIPIVFEVPTRHSEATHALTIAKPLVIPGLGFTSFYVKRDKIRDKRDVKKEKKNYDYFTNINDYWKEIRDKTEIDIKNVEADSYLPKYDARDYADVPERDNNKLAEDRDYDKNLNWDVLKDGKQNSDGEIRHILKEASRKLVQDLRDFKKEEHKKVVFPSLNDDEMRMLSDDPMTVEAPQDIVLENELIKLTIDKRSGLMNYSSKTESINFYFTIGIVEYEGCVGNNMVAENRSSGAYIFRPNMSDPVTDATITDIIKTPNNEEVTIYYGETRVMTLGIDLNAIRVKVMETIKEGKESVLRIKTGIQSNAEFYTDANGRQMLKRIRDRRPQWNLKLAEPIPGNYYPITHEFFIEDDNIRIIMNIDRAKGVTSMEDGTVDVMTHRRLKHDDAFGVGEALNETAGGKGLYVFTDHLFQIVKKTKLDFVKAAHLSQSYFSPQQMYVADASDLSLEDFVKMRKSYSLIKSMPLGLHLLSLEQWSDREILIRIENYLDETLSPEFISVDLAQIFNTIKITAVKETTLAANMLLSDYKQWKWNAEEEFCKSFNEAYGTSNAEKAKKAKEFKDDGLTIKLKPKQIRTFIAEYEFVKL